MMGSKTTVEAAEAATVESVVLPTVTVRFDALAKRTPYGVRLVERDGGYALPSGADDEVTVLVYGMPWNGALRTVKAIVDIAEDAMVEVVEPATMLAHAETIRQHVKGVSVCQHGHDYDGLAAEGIEVPRPVGVTWAYGWLRNPGMGRDCPVCTPKASRHACQGNVDRTPHGYSALREATKATCSGRHEAWATSGKAAKEAAAKEAAKTKEAEEAAARLAAAEAEKPKATPRKRASRTPAKATA